MNIGFSYYPAIIGGVEIGSIELCAWLASIGHRTWMHVRQIPREYGGSLQVFLDRADLFGIEVITSPDPDFVEPMYRDADALILYNHNCNVSPRMAELMMRCKRRIAIHGGELDHYVTTDGAVKPNILWSVSENLKAWAISRNSAWRKRPVFVSEFPMDERFWDVRGKANYPRRIGSVGRVVDFKRPQLVAKWAKELGCDALFCGDGDIGNAIRTANPKAVVVPSQPDVRRVYERLGIYVLPSIREGFPRALAEAMMMRRPVVATSVGGIPHSGVSPKWLFRIQDENEMRDAVAKIIGNNDLSSRIGDENRAACLNRSMVVSSTIENWLSKMQ